MAGGGAQVEGVARLRATLDSAARELASLDLGPAGQLLAQSAAARAPRRSGFLSESHGFTVVPGGFTVTAAAPYSAYVHAVNPWLIRELDAQTDNLIDITADHVADVVSTIQGA